MAEYRAFIIGIDGRFLRAIELACPDDDSAKEYARQLADGHDVVKQSTDHREVPLSDSTGSQTVRNC